MMTMMEMIFRIRMMMMEMIVIIMMMMLMIMETTRELVFKRQLYNLSLAQLDRQGCF